MVNSNKIFLLVSLVYLIILLKKTQNYQFSLFLMLVNLLPFTIGRNILEVELMKQSEIWGYSLFDVKFFVPLYLSDLFLLLIYQNYLSQKIFGQKIKFPEHKLNSLTKKASLLLIAFLLTILLGSITSEFNTLLIAGSLIIVKFILIFLSFLIIDLKDATNQSKFYQLIASMTAFQVCLILIEQFKGQNIGKFIENRLPGLEIGTRAAESANLLRADGTFNEPNIAAIFLLMNGLLLINYFLKLNYKQSSQKNFIYLLVGVMAILAIIFTGSRSLYALATIFIIYFLKKYFFSLKEIARKLFNKKILFSLIFLASLILPYLFTRIDTLRNIFSEDGSLNYRIELNKHALSLMQKNILFGVGLDLTPYYLAKNFKTVDSPLVIFDQAPAHNLIIQLLSETGLLGFLCFSLFILLALKTNYLNQSIFFMSALAFLIAAQFHPVFTNHYELTSFFFLYLGLGMKDA